MLTQEEKREIAMEAKRITEQIYASSWEEAHQLVYDLLVAARAETARLRAEGAQARQQVGNLTRIYLRGKRADA